MPLSAELISDTYLSMRLQIVVNKAFMSLDYLAYSYLKIYLGPRYFRKVGCSVLTDFTATVTVKDCEEAGAIGSKVVLGDIVW